MAKGHRWSDKKIGETMTEGMPLYWFMEKDRLNITVHFSVSFSCFCFVFVYNDLNALL